MRPGRRRWAGTIPVRLRVRGLVTTVAKCRRHRSGERPEFPKQRHSPSQSNGPDFAEHGHNVATNVADISLCLATEEINNFFTSVKYFCINSLVIINFLCFFIANCFFLFAQFLISNPFFLLHLECTWQEFPLPIVWSK